MKILSGHYSPETSYVVDDYPYSFRLRCSIRYWLEVNKNGTRFVSQTTNPKKAYTHWNAPKKSTYCQAGAMFLKGEEAPENERGHVAWIGFNFYHPETAREFLATYKEGLTAGECSLLERVASGTTPFSYMSSLEEMWHNGKITRGQYDKARIIQHLVALGRSGDEVAESLAKLGVKGGCDSYTCPIAEYLKTKGFTVGVGRDGILEDVGGGISFSSLSLSGIRHFILGFDRGKYPQCEKARICYE